MLIYDIVKHPYSMINTVFLARPQNRALPMKSAARRNFVPLGLVAMPPSGCLVGPVGAPLPKPALALGGAFSTRII